MNPGNRSSILLRKIIYQYNTNKIGKQHSVAQQYVSGGKVIEASGHDLTGDTFRGHFLWFTKKQSITVLFYVVHPRVRRGTAN